MNVPFEGLIGDTVCIVPMETKHIQGLFEAGNDPAIWTHMFKNIQSPSDMESLVTEALLKKESGTEYPMVIIQKDNDKIIGSTRFLEISNANKGLEIGWTWLTPSVWRTHVNTECKYLLLQHCFETLQTIRVQIKTDARNIRAQEAIERIGAVKEGLLRNHMIRKDGTYRDSVVYSIIDREWESVREVLHEKLHADSI